MTEIGVWLLVVGLVDLVRASRDTTAASRRVLMVLLGVALLALAVVAFAPSAGVGAALLAGWLVAFLAWTLGSASAVGRRLAAPRAIAFAGWAGGIALSLVAGGRLEARLPGWVDGPLATLPPDRLVLVAGVLVAQLSTVNVLIRLTLDAVGVPASDNEKSLKGGRLLGPMERVLIIGLGLAGQLTAAGLVIAAKGLIRFPELQAKRDDRTSVDGVGIDAVTEYFLVGSFVSWLVALVSLALTR